MMKKLLLFLFILSFAGCRTLSRKNDVPIEEPTREAVEVIEKIERIEVPVLAANMLQRVHFDFDRSSIRPDAEVILEKNAHILKNHPEVYVEIEGHCDERGSNEYNLALGERRAFAVRNYLINLGISEDRISTISYGEENPLLNRSDPAAWAMNRRAEFIIFFDE